MSDPNTWILSDDDCFQHYKKLGDWRYAFVEIRDAFNEDEEDVFAACHGVVDLSDFSLEQIKFVSRAYYDSIENLIEQYGIDESIHIICECLFEDYGFDQMEFAKECSTYDSAKQFLQNWIAENHI